MTYVNLPLMKTGLSAIVAANVVLCAPTAVAQEVNLVSPDGTTIDVVGELRSFTDTSFTIETTFGPLTISRDRVECLGEACPDSDATDLAALDADAPVVWNVSLWGKRRAFTEHVEKLAELLEANTEGAFKLNISYGGLSDSRENLDGIAAGDFEMAQFCAGYHPEKNPSITVLELPFLGVTSLEQEVALSMAVYQHPATQADMARWNATLVMPSPLPQYNIVGAGTPPMSLADFNNMSVRATGGVGDAVAALGASLVKIPATEVQQALQSGDVNAVSFAPHAHMAFNTIDGGLWWTTNLNPGTVNCPVVMNTDAFDRLPMQHRVALISSIPVALDHYIDNYTSATMQAWDQALMDRGIIQLTFNENIIEAIDEAVAAPAAATWIEENTARGLPAQDLYDLVTSMVGTKGNS